MSSSSQQTKQPCVPISDTMDRTPESGPVLADALLAAAGKGKYQMVVVGHHIRDRTPLESVHCDDKSNVTVGVRTGGVWVDHGAQFNTASAGKAARTPLFSLAIGRQP